jgi:hypothetical protein
MGGIGGVYGGVSRRRRSKSPKSTAMIPPPSSHQFGDPCDWFSCGCVAGVAVAVGSGVSEIIETTIGVGDTTTTPSDAPLFVGMLVGFGVGFMVIIFLHTSGTDDQTALLSRTRQEAPRAPMVVYVCVVVMDPGLPTFFSMSCFVVSPKVNSIALIYPSVSTPLQVNVTGTGEPTAVEISLVKFAQTGMVFPLVGVGVGVGVDPEPVVGVGVDVFVTPV